MLLAWLLSDPLKLATIQSPAQRQVSTVDNSQYGGL